MFRRLVLQAVPIVIAGVLISQISTPAQDSIIAGLKGKVQTVLSEEFTSKDGVGREPMGSSIDVYDPAGYKLESFQYKADGSLWAHTIYHRSGPQVLRVDVAGTDPYVSHSEENVFDAEGHEIENDIYNANGVLVSKTTNEFFQQGPDSDILYQRTKTMKGTDTMTITSKISETTDSQTGITHQVTTKNGQISLDWVIQRNEDGTFRKEKAVQADGSYSESERKSDGTTLQDQYDAPTKMHTYTKLDSQGHVVEVIEASNSRYIRCTYSFDRSGRQTKQVNYDASGSIVDKSTSEYRDDSHGNWTERTSTVWNMKAGPVQSKIVNLTLRTITYY